MCYRPADVDREYLLEANRLFAAKDLEGLRELYRRAKRDFVSFDTLRAIKNLIEELEAQQAQQEEAQA